MNPFGTVLQILAVIAFTGLISAPGILITYIGWRLSRGMRPALLQTLFRAGLTAVACTPSAYGHAGILPAIVLVLVLRGRERLAGIIPIVVVWVLVTITIVICARARRRGHSSPRGSHED